MRVISSDRSNLVLSYSSVFLRIAVFNYISKYILPSFYHNLVSGSRCPYSSSTSYHRESFISSQIDSIEKSRCPPFRELRPSIGSMETSTLSPSS